MSELSIGSIVLEEVLGAGSDNVAESIDGLISQLLVDKVDWLFDEDSDGLVSGLKECTDVGFYQQ